MSVSFSHQTPFRSEKTVRSPFVLSPMAAYTSWPFRLLCQQYGSGCTITEMAKPEHIISSSHQVLTSGILSRHPSEHILGAQLVGADPALMEQAAQIIADRGFDFIDLNCACPSRRILKTGAGGALLESPDRIASLIGVLKKSGLPVTVKLRSGTKGFPRAGIAAARTAGRAGASAVWYHARSLQQGHDQTGTADHTLSAELVAAADIPVFVGGGIGGPRAAVRLLNTTGAAGVTMGTCALGNPFVFQQALDILNGRNPAATTIPELTGAMRSHFSGLESLMPPRRAYLHMRALFLHYLPAMARFESYRLKGKRLTSCFEAYDILDAIDAVFSDTCFSLPLRGHTNQCARETATSPVHIPPGPYGSV